MAFFNQHRCFFFITFSWYFTCQYMYVSFSFCLSLTSKNPFLCLVFLWQIYILLFEWSFVNQYRSSKIFHWPVLSLSMNGRSLTSTHSSLCLVSHWQVHIILWMVFYWPVNIFFSLAGISLKITYPSLCLVSPWPINILSIVW